MKTKYPHFNQLDSFEKLKIILNPVIPDKEILPSHRPVNIILWGGGGGGGGRLKHNIVAMINEITKPRIIW